MTDDPVPKSVQRAMRDVELKDLADALQRMPIRQSGDEARMNERIGMVRKSLRKIEENLWARILSQPRWRSPLLVLDEAHHLKNPNTQLARRFQSIESENDFRTGDGALARVFDRMLFLTATPFQLGHRELVRVLERFGDIRWDPVDLGDFQVFRQRLRDLEHAMDESQRSAVALQLAWAKLALEEVGEDPEAWWTKVTSSETDQLTYPARTARDAFMAAKASRTRAQNAIRPWILRHNKEALWAGTQISRRRRLEGSAIQGDHDAKGLVVPPQPAILPGRAQRRTGQ
jgi:hypothetical protein